MENKQYCFQRFTTASDSDDSDNTTITLSALRDHSLFSEDFRESLSIANLHPCVEPPNCLLSSKWQGLLCDSDQESRTLTA